MKTLRVQPGGSVVRDLFRTGGHRRPRTPTMPRFNLPEDDPAPPAGLPKPAGRPGGGGPRRGGRP